MKVNVENVETKIPISTHRKFSSMRHYKQNFLPEQPRGLLNSKFQNDGLQVSHNLPSTLSLHVQMVPGATLAQPPFAKNVVCKKCGLPVEDLGNSLKSRVPSAKATTALWALLDVRTILMYSLRHFLFSWSLCDL